ncbi:hypothetical protein EV360DRAFT_85723 [Lentinula raphanica]|nr:hypothetical protein EV360DRAFT_85723 [Lentinula raphanica]
MVLLHGPNITVMFFAALGMISVLALPVLDETDHSAQTQGITLNSKSVDQRSSMDARPRPPLQPSAKHLQLGPGESNIWPPTGPQKPMRLPPVAIPPGFPQKVQVQLYERNPQLPEYLTLEQKVHRLTEIQWFWLSISPDTRDKLRSPAEVRQEPDREKLLIAHLISLYNKPQVLAQIEWIKQSDFHSHLNRVFQVVVGAAGLFRLRLEIHQSNNTSQHQVSTKSHSKRRAVEQGGTVTGAGKVLFISTHDHLRHLQRSRAPISPWPLATTKQCMVSAEFSMAVASGILYAPYSFKMVQSLANLTLLNKAQHQDPTESLSSAFNPATCA